MKGIKFMIAAALLAVATSASAQFANANGASTSDGILVKENSDYNRIQFGYAPQIFAASYMGYSGESMTAQGFKAGYLHGFNITGQKLPLFVELGADLNFNTKGDALFLGGGTNVTTNLLSFNIPINLAYKLSFKNGMWIEPYAGMSFKVNAVARMKANGESVNLFNVVEDLKRFQYGGQIGANLGYKCVNVNIGYHWDMPIYNVEGYKLKTKGVIVTLGYNF